jgi:hypothetical protein
MALVVIPATNSSMRSGRTSTMMITVKFMSGLGERPCPSWPSRTVTAPKVLTVSGTVTGDVPGQARHAVRGMSPTCLR